MKMRVVPEIKFEFDGSIARGSELSALIKDARSKDGDETESPVIDSEVNESKADDPAED